jgi:hypothetical protein
LPADLSVRHSCPRAAGTLRRLPPLRFGAALDLFRGAPEFECKLDESLMRK